MWGEILSQKLLILRLITPKIANFSQKSAYFWQIFPQKMQMQFFDNFSQKIVNFDNFFQKIANLEIFFQKRENLDSWKWKKGGKLFHLLWKIFFFGRIFSYGVKSSFSSLQLSLTILYCVMIQNYSNSISRFGIWKSVSENHCLL